MQTSIYDMTQEDWRAFDLMVQSIDEIIETRGLRHELVFHGTSDHHRHSISTSGLKATDVAHAKWYDDHDDSDIILDNSKGTFWGRVTTAAWYAADNVTERYGFGRPLLVVTTTASLLQKSPLCADMATVDGPVDKSMPIIADPAVIRDWMGSGAPRTWTQGLDELGAVFAIHHDFYPSCEVDLIESVEDFEAYLTKVGLSVPSPKA